MHAVGPCAISQLVRHLRPSEEQSPATPGIESERNTCDLHGLTHFLNFKHGEDYTTTVVVAVSHRCGVGAVPDVRQGRCDNDVSKRAASI